LRTDAQTYPSKPVRILIGFPPGAGSDIVTRLVTPGLSKGLGQQFIVDNRPGATGNIAAELVARAPADGYTLLCVTSTLAVNHSLHKKPPVDLLRDYDAVALLATLPFVLVVHPSRSSRRVRGKCRSRPPVKVARRTCPAKCCARRRDSTCCTCRTKARRRPPQI
jgi:tripartite-type tricarboxylate transporter receptor subunit TctC